MRKPDPFDLALYGLIITVFVAFIYWFQLRSMQDSVEPARRNMQIDQRAWLGVTEVAVAPQLREGVMFNPTAYAANSGKTPALNVTQIAGWKKVPAGEQIDCAYEVSTSKPINEGVIQPNAKRELSPAFSGALSKEVADELTSGRFRFYMFGKITYDDIFRSRHETTFCMRLDTAGNAAFSPFGPYNDAD